MLTAILLCGCAPEKKAPDAASTTTPLPTLTGGADHGTEAIPGKPPAPFGGGAPAGMAVGVTTQVQAVHADISKRDANGTWEDASAVHISFSGASAEIDGTGASFDAGILTIHAAGTYVVSGDLHGSIVIDAEKDDKIQLVLNGANIACDNGPALHVRRADKVFITAAAGTANALSDASAYEDADDGDTPDGCLFSKDDLTINGAGSLAITGSYKHGVVGKDALVVCDTQLTVTAATDGIKSNDGTTITGNATLTVTAADDAIETEGDCIIESGAVTMHAGGNGVHADGGIYVNDGLVDVQSSVEGMEGLVVCFSGGETRIVSSDDGVNATGSEEAKSDVIPGAIIAVLGGKLSVSASGDGLDSNGDLLIAGGETYVSIDMHTGNGALDASGGCEYTGGVLAATGGADMLQTVLSDEEHPILCVVTETEQAANTIITLSKNGDALLAFTPAFSWQSVVLCAPAVAIGDTLTLSVGNAALCTVSMDSAWTAYGNSGFGGQRPGGKPQESN